MLKKLFLIGTLLSSSLLFSSSSTTPFTSSTIPILDLSQIPTHCSNLGYTGFNNSPELGLYLASLAKNYNVDIAFETGTCEGITTIFLAHHFAKVYTAEIFAQYFLNTQKIFRNYPNIVGRYGSSEKLFHEILPSLQDKRILFYLDAHWYEQWPLLDELEEISLTHKDNCIVVIDDFKVPTRPEITYDAYGQHECSFDYISEQLNKVFTDYTCFYLIPKNPQMRAKFVAYPKSWGICSPDNM
jgi:predicted O-methyltransferase YrrM